MKEITSNNKKPFCENLSLKSSYLMNLFFEIVFKVFFKAV